MKRGILIGTRIDCEDAARIIRETPNREELAKRFGRTRERMRRLIWELREAGYDCGDWGKNGRPKDGAK